MSWIEELPRPFPDMEWHQNPNRAEAFSVRWMYSQVTIREIDWLRQGSPEKRREMVLEAFRQNILLIREKADELLEELGVGST